MTVHHHTTQAGFSEHALSTLMTPMKGRGKELCEMLRAELKIPDSVQWFEVRFHREEAVTVRCQYAPRA